MKTILGLDLGTNSIGWALIEKDEEKNEGKIIKAGSRIIPMSQDVLGKFDSGQSISQTSERTKSRGIRRLRERQLLRRERLLRVLNILGFLPEHFSSQIDFEIKKGQFLRDTEPKIAYNTELKGTANVFLFQKSLNEMLAEFSAEKTLPGENKKVPYDWTIYYLRKKALTQKIDKHELAWILLNFNQKRGYSQLRGEEEEELQNKKVEFYALKVVKVEDSGDKKGADEIWYNVHLENGWIYRRISKTHLDWEGKIKEFIVTTELNEDGSVKKTKEGKDVRSFKAPEEKDWTLLKKKTEFDIDNSNLHVGEYIYKTLLKNPNQKIKGKLVRTIERKYYKAELTDILIEQIKHHPELNNNKLFSECINELYSKNENHRKSLESKDFLNLFLNDILFYQRPLKSKKHLISNCQFETRKFLLNGTIQTEHIKCIAKSHPLFQEFRLLQFLQNLRIYEKEKVVEGRIETDVNVTNEFLQNENDWFALCNFLNDKAEITQDSFFKYPAFNLKKNREKYRWNYVEDKEKKYPCNETRALILNRFKKAGLESIELTKEDEIALWHILYSVEDKNDIVKALRTFATKRGYSNIEEFVGEFQKTPPFKKEYGSYSLKAINKLLSLMRFGGSWSEENIDKNTLKRIEKILNGEADDSIKNRVREKAINLNCLNDFQGLPLWLASYVIYDRHSESGNIQKWKTPEDLSFYIKNVFKQHELRNPIVEQVVLETLRVVNDVWVKLGKSKEEYFSEIHVELGREMKNNAEKRAKMSKKSNDNEATNLRLKLLLTELKNDASFENIRPYSPTQLEILKIYEEGVLSSEIEIPDEISKIAKLAQPSTAELTKYKLWLQQKYRSPYTGEIIPLAKLFTPAYEIEHIIPQSRYFDDSLSNKVICEAEVNKDKDNETAYEYIKENSGKKIELSYGRSVSLFTIEQYSDFVKSNYSKNRSKFQKLMMEDIPEEFIQRQLNDSRYISKVINNLMSNIVREENEVETNSKNVIPCNGNITSQLKQDWGLNDVWNDIITPRFERMNELTQSTKFGEWTNKDGKKVFQTNVPLEYQKGFSKKRIDHRHHALDAIVIACTTRDHINYLNNESALGKGSRDDKQKKRYDLRSKICTKKYTNSDKSNYNWEFKKPWEHFTINSKEQIESIIVSFKQNLRVINKTSNKYFTYKETEKGDLKKQLVSQTGKTNWAIRKPLHKDTVSGLVNLKLKKDVSFLKAIETPDLIVDKVLKKKVNELIITGTDKKAIVAEFKKTNFIFEERDYTKVEVYYFNNDYVASRVKLDDSFNSDKIESITDSGIRIILKKHLSKYSESKGGKIIEHPELAFSDDGIDDLNKNIIELNNGRFHQPILKVRTFETKGNKFNVGHLGNKKDKWVEAAKGTNLFFAIYENEEGVRSFESVPFNVVVQNQIEGLPSVPQTKLNEKTGSKSKLLFVLSPNDLVCLPNMSEKDGKLNPDNVFKMVSSTGNECYFVQASIAKPIVNKVEFSPLNKAEKNIHGIQIKSVCRKVLIDRLGNYDVVN